MTPATLDAAVRRVIEITVAFGVESQCKANVAVQVPLPVRTASTCGAPAYATSASTSSTTWASTCTHAYSGIGMDRLLISLLVTFSDRLDTLQLPNSSYDYKGHFPLRVPIVLRFLDPLAVVLIVVLLILILLVSHYYLWGACFNCGDPYHLYVIVLAINAM